MEICEEVTAGNTLSTSGHKIRQVVELFVPSVCLLHEQSGTNHVLFHQVQGSSHALKEMNKQNTSFY